MTNDHEFKRNPSTCFAPISGAHKVSVAEPSVPALGRPFDIDASLSKKTELPIASDPKPSVSIERLVFLERLEKIMASEARIKEIEAENKTLIGMVGRLQKEIDDLKKGSPRT